MGPDGEGVDQIQLTQDRMQWQDFVNFLASWATINVLRKSLHYVVS
jgi:hypothetical protein